MRKQGQEIKDKKRKTTLIVIVAAFLVVVYATFAQPLAYNMAVRVFNKITDVFDFGNNNNNNNNNNNGTNNDNKNDSNSNITGNNKNDDEKPGLNDITSTTPENWNIKFTNAIKNGINGNAREITPVKYDALSVSFDVALTGPNDAINYEFTISNEGTIKAVIDEIVIVPENNDNSVIAYDVDGIEVGDKLYPGESTKMNVKVYYNDKIDSDIKYYNDNLKIVINYVQD